MSLKEDLKAVKEELNTEEQFLEGLIRAERFYKKYKKPIIALAAVCVIAFIGFSIKSYMDEANLKAANIAYLKLIKNPNDSEAAKTLKDKNINLYYAYKLQVSSKNGDVKALQEVKNGAKDIYISDLADYQLASLSKKPTALSGYVDSSKAGLLKNFALLEDAYLLLKEKKNDQAKIKLSSIELDSPLKNIAKNLEHFIKY